jgi:hypothetical protein
MGLASTDRERWVMCVRHKSGVYGEWKLWSVTARAAKWWRQRSLIRVASGVTTFLVNAKGQRSDSPTKGNHTNFQLTNMWFRLTKQIQKDDPEFRTLSLNKLRKTTGNVVRAGAGGEVAGVFLCHGQPVRADDLLDVYTNRPFARVFEAIDRVGATLKPVWAEIDEPFPDLPPRGGRQISLGTIRRIQQMSREGHSPREIAELVGVSISTVERWVKRMKQLSDDA